MQLFMPLWREQLISHPRIALVDTIASIHGSERKVIPAIELHKLCTKIHDIVDNAVSKWTVIQLVF